MANFLLDASRDMKLTLVKDLSYYILRSDKLGRRCAVLVVFQEEPEGYALRYDDWLRFIGAVSGRHILFGFGRRVKAYFAGCDCRRFEEDLRTHAIPFHRERPKEKDA